MSWRIQKAEFLLAVFAIASIDTTLSWMMSNEGLLEISIVSWITFFMGFNLKDPD
jgi:hypothetical protein